MAYRCRKFNDCLVAGGKKTLLICFMLHIFDDVGVATVELLNKKLVGPGLNPGYWCERDNHYTTDLPEKTLAHKGQHVDEG